MHETRGYRHRVSDSLRLHRGQPPRGRAVAELPEAVIPPAAHGAVGDDCTGVAVARRHAHRVVHSLCGDRVGAVGRRAVAELAEVIEPPAGDGAVVTHRAGVGRARRDGDGAGQAGDADYRHRGVTLGGGIVTELTGVVFPPAAGGAVGAQGAVI